MYIVTFLYTNCVLYIVYLNSIYGYMVFRPRKILKINGNFLATLIIQLFMPTKFHLITEIGSNVIAYA